MLYNPILVCFEREQINQPWSIESHHATELRVDMTFVTECRKPWSAPISSGWFWRAAVRRTSAKTRNPIRTLNDGCFHPSSFIAIQGRRAGCVEFQDQDQNPRTDIFISNIPTFT